MPASNQEPREGFIAVGRVLRPWGLRGDLKVESLTDFPERFDPGARLWLAERERTVERSRAQTGALYVKFAGISDPTDAERYRGLLIEIPESALPPLQSDEFYHHQLVGLRAVTSGGDELGTVREVLSTGGNAVLVVDAPEGEVLLPFIEEVVGSVDLGAATITVEMLDGLMPEARERQPRVPPRRWRSGRKN
ncbi:MAG: ribosome maturation factor RimM [Dehalococcoidia bacterium]